jgi:hypothetical protein
MEKLTEIMGEDDLCFSYIIARSIMGTDSAAGNFGDCARDGAKGEAVYG